MLTFDRDNSPNRISPAGVGYLLCPLLQLASTLFAILAAFLWIMLACSFFASANRSLASLDPHASMISVCCAVAAISIWCSKLLLKRLLHLYAVFCLVIAATACVYIVLLFRLQG